MQTTNLEMSKDLSEAFLNPRTSSLFRWIGRRERRSPAFLDPSSVAKFLESKSGQAHRAHSPYRFVTRDDTPAMAARFGARSEQ